MRRPGTLYIIGTPIGNLDDISHRALETLKAVDVIAAEDTRHTGKLLHHFQISTAQLSYHQHNIQQRTPELVEKLCSGQTIALVTDAGMPGICDPGWELIQACIKAEISVVPIPGPVAAIAALVASGLPTHRFCFEGFLPTKTKDRRDRLAQLQRERRTMILYESPHRLRQTLADLSQTCGEDRPLVLARELTKRFETFWRGSLSEAIAFHRDHDPRGEYTLVLGGATATDPDYSDDQLLKLLQEKLQQGISPSQASKELAQRYPIPRRRLYQLTLQIIPNSPSDPPAD
ncbi:16S rRNA (cytidine(1402)-2'-O)-methyltransferase [Lyngbya confervoides]|uniref:Ribosomal RNA small subunit methyltransferase I n=1 Tax=Lyngbya confervoides BDU141951 TaxID=1574623 RepID=A0ABD4T512_9CYAN|nr:16S rRNA (cytidine(1402)-2'-O)-methyltransferase [Lyngbya confervoides]MCM1983588.1 16S rRNA (cytidine(1402)-2'-O)-methyltransferase [Lyngbya confervoides BDU141951]